MPVLGAVIGGVTSIAGGIIGGGAAKAAAKTQAAAAQAVAGSVEKSTASAVDAGYKGIEQANSAVHSGLDASGKYIGDAGAAQKDIYGNLVAGLDPYKNAGLTGLDKMQSTAGTFAFNPSDLENDPGYKFQLAQGQKALANSAASKGMLMSGSALKSLDQYSQGLAGTSYQNAYNRALSTYQTNQAGYQSLANLGTNANSQAISAGGTYGGQLTSLANLGTSSQMQGASLLDNTAMQGNQYVGNIGLTGMEKAGDIRLGGANATAAGQVGQANAWNSALTGVAGALGPLSNMQANPGPVSMPGGWSASNDPWAGGGVPLPIVPGYQQPGPAPAVGPYPG
jgi:hypothetical protein